MRIPALLSFQKIGQHLCQLALFLAAATMAQVSHAQLTAMVAIDPSAPRDVLSGVYNDVTATLSKSLGQTVRVSRSTNFADVLRATRTGEYDIYIVPGQVAASALSHGYTLIGATGKQETFVLVVNPRLKTVDQLKGAKMYLPQEDSVYTYMAKGLLNESGVSLKELGAVQYGNTSGAGLAALLMGVADATVTRKSEYESWIKANAGKAAVLLESKPVPAGLSLLAGKALSDPERAKLTQWVTSSAPGQSGLGQFGTSVDSATYAYIGGLGHFTPLELPGVQRVSAEAAADLMKKGAVMVDVRSEKEYRARHIAGAVWAPYLEKSAKDTTFDAKADDFSALDKLDKSKPAIFGCNGAECWKSYKASKVALGKGFKTVYWLRGGLPAWEARNLATAAN
jgi:rhodanese-related sulfurtransferase/ABC-type phosphate/phosphonate transport system substrate-binding protein